VLRAEEKKTCHESPERASDFREKVTRNTCGAFHLWGEIRKRFSESFHPANRLANFYPFTFARAASFRTGVAL